MSADTPIILDFLKKMDAMQASDLYLTVGFPPSVRTDQGLHNLREDKLNEEEVGDIIAMILTNRQRREFEGQNELNTALDMGVHGRYRVNVLKQRQMPALVIRRIISTIPSFEELRLPKILETLSMSRRGLVLLTGMTGSGKSTTLASMVDHRNQNEQGHIITIEDPIEYFHAHKQSVVTQREVGVDTDSFSVAMKNALRQRPDVILVGEIRDRDVMEQALTIAETGHLCLATLHTNNAYQAIERIVNLFPEDYHNQIRLNLSMNLKAIVSQRLLPCTQGGLTVALEVMLNLGLVRELILKGEIGKIKEIMESNVQEGMITFDQSLINLFAQGLITEDVCIAQSDQPADMRLKIQQFKLGGQGAGPNDILTSLDTSRLSISD